MHRTSTDHAVLEELRRTSPPPPELDLPPEVRSRQRDALLRTIDAERAIPALPRRPHRRVALATGVGVGVAAAALAAVLGPGGPAPSRAAPDAVVVLDRFATVAATAPATPVRADQFVHVRSLVRTNTGRFGGRPRLGPVHRRSIWLPQAERLDGPGRGLIREQGRDVPIRSVGGSSAGIDRPTYAWFAALPRDPETLLRDLSSQVRAADGQQPAQAVFDAIGSLLRESVMPPGTAAALYRALGRVPGVTVVPDAVDLAGRHGVGIARQDDRYHVRDEWIFDPDDGAFLGDRSYLVGADGSRRLFACSAVLARSVTDRAGQG